MYSTSSYHSGSSYAIEPASPAKYRPLQIDHNDKMPKYKQIVQAVINDIERGYYVKNEQLMSITELSIEYLLSRDTVEKAYRELKAKGYIISVQGKGYFVKSKREQKLKVLLVLNKMCSYKKTIYYSFLEKLGKNATVDLQIHNYELDSFEEIIERNLGKYNYYVVMPHFEKGCKPEDYLSILEKIPENELILLDRQIPDLDCRATIFQDFEKDLFNAFESHLEPLRNYDRLELIFPENANYPEEIKLGFRTFCAYNDFEYCISEDINDRLLQFCPNTAYVVIEDNDLAEVIKFTKKHKLTQGKEIGLISFNDSTLKEALEITVVSTDFEAMGSRAAEVLLNGKTINEKNPFYLIDRGSV